MIILSTFLLAFVGLASTSGLENWSQLVHKALDLALDRQLHEAISAYQTSGYYIFGNFTKEMLMNPDLKRRVHSLEENPLAANNTEVQEVYEELFTNDDVWSTLVDPIKFRDAFKVGILVKGLSIGKEALENMMPKVQLMIREESKQNFSVPNPHLESLYREMFHNDKFTADFILSKTVKLLAQVTGEYCALPKSTCSLRLKVYGQMLLSAIEDINKILPFDNESKIHRVVATLPRYLKYRDLLQEEYENNNVKCFSWGCWMRINATEKPETTTFG